ncbi:hypothetical protein ACTQ40_10135 [Collinsella sp. Sow4_D11]|uniref:hypothetical protein n=1 Tax=Collinsella sp. Sow4_D11 TaxID=3438775 RepID=UPI003F927982
MTEKLGVLLVDVPEPKCWNYSYIVFTDSFTIENTDAISEVFHFGHRCTQEEAKKYPQFRWVALEDL